MSVADHLDALTREMELLQDSVHCNLKTAHACCIAGRTQEAMLPISRHFYPKCQRKDPNVATCEEIWSSLPTTMAGCDSSESNSWPIYESMPIWTTSHAGNHLSMDGFFSAVIKWHRKCSLKMMDLPVTKMTLMMNAWHLLRMKLNKIEGHLTHSMNAQINIIWWLNIWQCMFNVMF